MGALAIVSFILAFLCIPWNSPPGFTIFVFLTIVFTIAAIVRHMRRRKEMPYYKEQPIVPIDPPWETLSGTFICSSCGAPTTFNREINPSTACSYCGSELPGIKEMILERNQRRQQKIDDDLEGQKRDQRERLNIHLANQNRYIEVSSHAKAEQTKEVAKATLALGVAVSIIILACIIFPLYLIFH